MGEMGKELLRERIKSKRAWEGKDDLTSEDLFAKKPKSDLTAEEKEKLGERRQRNKEAAEKSRKKKKEEFEKIQNENDQLNQDKCEMAAMIEKLKSDVKTLTSEKSALSQNNDQLKRWIGTRASVLGLNKHRHQRRQQGAQEAHPSPARPPAEQGKSPQRPPRGERSVYSLSSLAASSTPPPSSFAPSRPDDFPRPPSPASSTASSPTPPPPSSHLTPPPPSRWSPSPAPLPQFQAVGIKQSVRLSLQTPWLVDPVPAAGEEQETRGKKKKEEEEKEDVVFTGITHSAPDPRQALTPPLSPRAVPQAEEDQQQQVLYLPKNTYLIVQGDDGRAYPIGQQVTMTTPQLVLANPAAQQQQQQQHVTMATPSAEATLQTPAAPVQYKPFAASRLTLEARSRSPAVREAPSSTPIQARDPMGYPIQTEKPQDAASVKQAARKALEAEEIKKIKALQKLGCPTPTYKPQDTASARQAACIPRGAEAEALEALLKLGYKIEKPEDAASKKQAANDHDYDTPGAVLTIPMDAPEDASTVTITTTPYNMGEIHNMTAITTASAL